MDTRELALSKVHAELNAKMIPFAGYNMPVRYSSDKEEHLAVREKVGLFDISHMGEFYVRGKGAMAFIQYVTSNDVSVLEPGKIQYSCFPNENGGIIDDLLVYMLNENDYLLVVNAANIEKDWSWLIKHQEQFDVELQNKSDDISLFALQGPEANAVIKDTTGVDLSDLKYYTSTTISIAGFDDILISATGYTGAGGFELYVENSQAEPIWELLMRVGQNHGILPIGLGARDTLRLEMGYCLYGNDIDDNTSPLEAGLGWITKLKTEFIGKVEVEAVKAKGIQKKLVGFEVINKGIARPHYSIEYEGEVIGEVTSGTISPVLNKGIGMAYLNIDFAKIGQEIDIVVRNKTVRAKVVKMPFIR